MNQQSSIFQKLFQQCLDHTNSLSFIERIASAYLNQEQIKKQCVAEVLGSELSSIHESPWVLVEKWRETLALILILLSTEELSAYRPLILERISRLHAVALWREFQLLSAYQAVVGLLMNQHLADVSLCQLPSGACPLEGAGHWSWGEVPHPLFQAELGLLWCLYSLVSGSTSHLKAAERLAEWQKNTLDYELFPFVGLFSQEGRVDKASLLAHNYVLFKTIGSLSRRSDMAYIAEKQHSHLSTLLADEDAHIPFFAAILDAWFAVEQIDGGLKEIYHLPKEIEDSHLALAGYRTSQTSAIATLFGGGSGMGCFHHQDVQIVSFGPQHPPLGDCRGFGLEGSGRLLANHVRAVKATDGTFTVEGVARMASRPKPAISLASFGQGDPAGFWLDATLHFQHPCLEIKTRFHSLYGYPMAFAFFVNAQSCLIHDHLVKRRSFAHYKGDAQPVLLKGAKGAVCIEAHHSHQGEMHVIPLGGGGNFWGADFLIAFMMENMKSSSWQITVR